MTNAEAARSMRPIEELYDHPIVLLHKFIAVSDSMTSSITGTLDVVNNAACLSTALACDKPNKIIAADNLDVQVFAAMKKA
ncbi:MAG TPA: hypothetical protein VL921_20440 [Candidatus Udaeobacter sp.]|jgi:hypothetical protein|nr:hypothetical protein [Candidatus Udaeobacter sp.]